MNTNSSTATDREQLPQTPDSTCHKEPRTTCCSLDCIEQPRFFCGQLLTDRELMKLLGWSQNKFRLARFRQGWGVVCGLEVRCDSNPKCSSRIIVEPGYAVDCCGDDIVVCEQFPYDLKEACCPEQDPCLEFKQKSAKNTQHVQETFAGRDLPDGHTVRAVDLFIGYREEPAEPTAAFGRDVCRQVAGCEYGRTRETFTLFWRPAVGDGISDLETAEESWLEAYDSCLEVVYSFQKNFKPPPRKTAWKGWRRWLLEWIERRPLQEFCFVRDWICEMPEVPKNEADPARLLFFLVQDCRNAFLKRTCYECDEDSRIRLARVYLQTGVYGHSRCCKILAIDDRPPYRRELSLVKLPARMDSVNLGDLIWRRRDEAKAMLADLNVKIGEEIELKKIWPKQINDIVEVFNKDVLVVENGATVNVKTLDLKSPLGKRVVGFEIP